MACEIPIWLLCAWRAEEEEDDELDGSWVAESAEIMGSADDEVGGELLLLGADVGSGNEIIAGCWGC